MKLTAPTREDVQRVREWRNEEPQLLRTPYLLTEEMQDDFYNNVICKRGSKHRYFSIVGDGGEPKPERVVATLGGGYQMPKHFIGFGGLTNIEWENGCAEISLIINPEYRGQGYGRAAVELLFRQGFDNMRLDTIYGEVYHCGNVDFWRKVIAPCHGYETILKGRKYYNGKKYDSTWFAVSKDAWRRTL